MKNYGSCSAMTDTPVENLLTGGRETEVDEMDNDFERGVLVGIFIGTSVALERE